MKDWKQAERRIAAMLGGERVPVSGRGRGFAPDIEHPALAVEVKTRASLPAWIEDAMRQAEAAAEVDARYFDLPRKTPVTVLHNGRKPTGTRSFFSASRSSRRWFGSWSGTPTGRPDEVRFSATFGGVIW